MNRPVSMTENGIPYSFAYDKRGNLTEERRNCSLIRQYTYDATNHLVLGKNTESGEQTEYGYNALYMRVRKAQTLTGGIKETSFVSDYLSHPCNDLMAYEKGGSTIRSSYGRGYELLAGKVLPGAAATNAVAQTAYFKSDLPGSPLFAANEQGELLHYADRNVWGELKTPMQGADNLAGLEECFRFTSYCYDPVIGKHFAHARFYDGIQGRMLAQDPVRRGLNPYTYCGNNPVNEADPTGEVSILAGGFLGGLVGGAFGFAGSAVSQLVSGEKFSIKKALGSAANGAVVGAVKGALVGSGVGIPAAFAADFAAGTVGSALEQKISTGDVDLRKSVTSGLTNAVSNVIYGNGPLKSVKSALARGAGAGAATAAINNISDALAAQTSSGGGGRRRDASGGNALGTSIPYGKSNDPRTICGSPDPFKFSVGYESARGYQYSASQASENVGKTKKKGFSLGDFLKDVAIGAVTGGLASVTFYGAGKAVDALKGSVSGGSNDSNLTIMSRNSGKGNPGAITHFDVDLNVRQKNLLKQLPNADSSIIIRKSDVNLKDLAALTAKTGDEFAMFTRGSQRMIVRGNANAVNINGTMAQELHNAGFKWSGHTHPGSGINVTLSSPGDRYILEQFNQTQSVILDGRGNFNIFEIGD